MSQPRLGQPARFPLSAVVGHQQVKLALLLNAVDPGIGGVLLRGHKGSAKTTLARGLASLLPGAAPFVELPVGSTEDRVVGSLDLRSALVEGRHRFSPGLLAAAHGGVLYVDEVNLLPDHLVDVLLDVAASGVNRVEREGVSEAHASRFVLVGSMNPEEGELRPQLLDRFGLAVDVVSSADPDERALAVGRRMGFDASPGDFLGEWAGQEEALRSRLAGAREVVCPRSGGPGAGLAPGLVRSVSALCASVGAEGLRADLVICRSAAALAAWEGRAAAGVEEVRRVADLALAHRRRRSPLEDPGIDRSELERALDDALGSGASGGSGAAGGPGASGGSGAAGGPGGSDPAGREDPDGSLEHQAPKSAGDGPENDQPGRPAAPGDPTPVVRLEAGRSQVGQVVGGRRTTAEGPRGRLVAARVPEPGSQAPIALGATLAAAAARRAMGGSDGGRPTAAGAGARSVAEGDLREAVRQSRTANLVVIAVDASGSMGVGRRMEAAKGAVLGLLVDAYQRRDRVALVTFGGAGATIALRPTASVEVARARLADLPTGGRTPLAEGIATALAVAEGSSSAPGPLRPLMVVISDGRATAGPPGTDPVRAAVEAAGQVRRRGVAGVVVDAEEGPVRLGLARGLAEAMGARYLSVAELSAGELAGGG